MAETAREMVWLQSFIQDLGISTPFPMPIDVSFCASLKHKDDGKKKNPNSQRQDIIIKYWVSIGSIHREQG